jgi:hypothetical protein
MTDTQLLLAGPAFALLALLMFSIPSVRPRAFTCGIGWLGAAMLFPMVIGYVFHSYGLITFAFFLKPIAAMVSAALFPGYLVMLRSKRLPVITSLPSMILLCGSAADAFAVYKLGNGWGGASC